MELKIKIAVPPACYGGMQIAALPLGGIDAALSGASYPSSLLNGGVVNAVNCRQVDIGAMVNYAAAEDVFLELPFFWPYDYLENPYTAGTSLEWQWALSLVALAPL